MSRWGLAYCVVWLAVLVLAAITNQPDPVLFTIWFALVILGPTIAIARYILGTGRKRQGKHVATTLIQEPTVPHPEGRTNLTPSDRNHHDR